MLSFESDYIAGAHPEILKRLTETNLESHGSFRDTEMIIIVQVQKKKSGRRVIVPRLKLNSL